MPTMMEITTISNDNLQLAFGKWIRARRNEMRLSQEQASSRAGITKQHWGRLEAGNSGTRRETAECIALALDLPLQEVLRAAGYATDSIDDYNLEEQEIITYYRGTPPDLRPAAKALLRELYKHEDAGNK